MVTPRRAVAAASHAAATSQILGLATRLLGPRGALLGVRAPFARAREIALQVLHLPAQRVQGVAERFHHMTGRRSMHGRSADAEQDR